jgi:hypothetical protein
MVRAQQALAEILLIGIDEEPQEVLMLKARALIEKFKAALAADHHAVADTEEQRSYIACELTKLRDAVDGEIDRRVDEDLVDTVCDLLEHLSSYLHEETGGFQDSTAPMNGDSGGDTASNVVENHRADIAEAAYRRAEQRQFEPGHDLEDWLAAERSLTQR